MRVKGFLVLFGPSFGKYKDKDGADQKYDFNNKFFELEEDAERSANLSATKAIKHRWNADDYQIVRIDCEGKVL